MSKRKKRSINIKVQFYYVIISIKKVNIKKKGNNKVKKKESNKVKGKKRQYKVISFWNAFLFT